MLLASVYMVLLFKIDLFVFAFTKSYLFFKFNISFANVKFSKKNHVIDNLSDLLSMEVNNWTLIYKRPTSENEVI